MSSEILHLNLINIFVILRIIRCILIQVLLSLADSLNLQGVVFLCVKINKLKF